MLNKYANLQPEFFDIVNNTIIKNNRISHAYFIETSDYPESEEIINSFVKLLLCPKHNTLDNACSNCNICNLIDSNSYNDLYTLRPDGNWIKKEQIIALKEELSNKSLEDNLRVYIIYDADKLNKSAANAMLKFLEEPENNIVGILVAKNRYNVINTLLSRCQILKLKSTNKKKIDNDLLVSMFDFIMNIERSGTKTICYINELWNSKYTNKENISTNFDVMRDIYMDIVDYKIKGTTVYLEFKNDVEFISSKNDVDSLIRKINVINSIQKDLDFNANLSLLMDRFIIELSGGDLFE